MVAGLPELREDDAPPAVRAVYAEIRQATGTPQVNLIWRHLALDPAVLGWAWRTIAPAYRDGRIAAAAGRLRERLSVPHRPPVWEGLADADATSVRAVLAFYDRGNTANLIGLTTLLHLAGAEAPEATAGLPAPQVTARSEGGSAAAAPEAAAAPVPRLPRREAVPPELMSLVTDLAERQGTAAFGVLPSLWLHLTLWPAAIRRAHATVGPLLDTPEWRTALRRLLAEAEVLAAGTASGLAPLPPPDDAAGRLHTVRRFVGTAIPQMVLAGRILSGAGRSPDWPS